MPRTKTSISLSQVRVGIFVLLAIVVLIFLILNASGDINPFASKLHLRARFADANGLRPGSEVRLAGVRSASVEKIPHLHAATRPGDKQVEASFAVDSTIDGQAANQRIRTDSMALQASPSLLGSEMIINITPGTAIGQPIQENAILPSSAANTIGDFATSGTDLAQRLTKLSDQLNEVVKDIREGKGTVGRLFTDDALYNNLNATVRDTEELMQQIKSGRGSAGKLIYDDALYNNTNEIAANLRKISEDIRAGRGSAGKFLASDEMYNKVNRLADRVNNSMDQIDSIVANVK